MRKLTVLGLLCVHRPRSHKGAPQLFDRPSFGRQIQLGGLPETCFSEAEDGFRSYDQRNALYAKNMGGSGHDGRAIASRPLCGVGRVADGPAGRKRPSTTALLPDREG